ncbi:MAG: dinitrogenase iron-molybdenum cofactor [Candidatus Syntrophonatronum acetioxidans]|uniref:Dinitrogenase iron-molybdenum cofactor n=1 Tax=Candidatus Syntrophonatronum acetioxidans TaxID=1795816 RepID=A0A424YE66_9FIRM|nr:MAG: dinitrogenase iron-molybdenum cofactor [Candidatus Syntrophonatronum acetioxidans]
MKIALATEDGFVAEHFGRCPEYTIVDIKGNQVVNQETILNPGHQPGFLPRYLSSFEVSYIIAGGMGPKAQNLFKERNIVPITGVSGELNQVINNFLRGQLEQGESFCDHGPGHTCDHD